MDDNNNFIEQENLRIMNEQANSWYNDPVKRDMIYGDWKTDKSRKSPWKGVLALLVFLLFTIAFILFFYNSL